MDVDLFIKKVEFLQSKMNQAMHEYFINERINDWYELNKQHYSVIRNDLGSITNSLRESAMLTCAKLFEDDTEVLSIHKIYNTILTNKFSPKEKHAKLIAIAKNIKDLIDKNNQQLADLKTWRDKYLAHFDNMINSKKASYRNTPLPASDIISVVSLIYDYFNDIFESFERPTISPTHSVYKDTIDCLFFDYELGREVRNRIDSKILAPIMDDIKEPD